MVVVSFVVINQFVVANSLCLLILWRYRNEDINMTSIGGCSKNDIMRPLHK
jgi:hypothetical protein